MSENLADAFLNGESLKNAPGPYFGEYGGRWMPYIVRLPIIPIKPFILTARSSIIR
mgnify:CR=1 FL=1